jgi:hypothetical protein
MQNEDVLFPTRSGQHNIGRSSKVLAEAQVSSARAQAIVDKAAAGGSTLVFALFT